MAESKWCVGTLRCKVVCFTILSVACGLIIIYLRHCVLLKPVCMYPIGPE